MLMNQNGLETHLPQIWTSVVSTFHALSKNSWLIYLAPLLFAIALKLAQVWTSGHMYVIYFQQSGRKLSKCCFHFQQPICANKYFPHMLALKRKLAIVRKLKTAYAYLSRRYPHLMRTSHYDSPISLTKRYVYDSSHLHNKYRLQLH